MRHTSSTAHVFFFTDTDFYKLITFCVFLSKAVKLHSINIEDV